VTAVDRNSALATAPVERERSQRLYVAEPNLLSPRDIADVLRMIENLELRPGNGGVRRSMCGFVTDDRARAL
jgi:hypothetical protein